MTVSYSPQFSSSKLFLIEVDEKTLSEMQSGNVFIKGGPDDHATLVTSDTTYSMRFHDNSNLQYVSGHKKKTLMDLIEEEDDLEHASSPKDGPSSSKIIIHATVDTLIKLERVFKPSVPSELCSAFIGPDQLHQLEYRVPASIAEMSKALLSDESVILGASGFMSISESERVSLMEMCMHAVNCLKPTPRGYEIEEAWLVLCDGDDQPVIAMETVRWLLMSIALHDTKDEECGRRESLRESIGSTQKGRFVKICPRKVQRARARQVLANNPDGLRLSTFLSSWRDLVLESPGCGEVACDRETLSNVAEGLLVYEDAPQGTIVRRCDISKLHSQPRDRLQQLFKIKKHWDRGELVIFMAPVFPEGTNIDSFLLKGARLLVIKGSDGVEKRVYTSLF